MLPADHCTEHHLTLKNVVMKIAKNMLLLLLLPLLAVTALDVWAQEVTPTATRDAPGTPAAEATPTAEAAPAPTTHIIEEGENLTTIAAQYEVTVADLMLVNGLDEDSLIYPGQELLLPGQPGAPLAAAYTVQVGDTLAGVARKFAITPAEIAATNHLVADTLYAGQSLSLISKNGSTSPQPLTGTLHYVQPGETMLMLAARYRLPPSQLAAANELEAPARLHPGMRLRIPGSGTYEFLPDGWREVRARPVPVTQGDTVSIYVAHSEEGRPSGTFAEQPLRFTPHENGYVALVGVDAFTEPGQYELTLTGQRERSWWPFQQEVQIVSANYPTQTINVPAQLAPLLAPEVRAEEDAYLSEIYSQFTPERYWDGLFQMPVTNTVVTAGYGGARSYNGGPFEIFHTGVDFGGSVGTPILAPAAGTVVFSDTLELRGNTVIIDHGLGVFSGYYHLSEIRADMGQQVAAGDVIGLGGSSGLSTGPHLHWELRVLDVPVNGQQWLESPFP